MAVVSRVATVEITGATGNPLGRVSIATGFAWNSRATAGWA